MGGARALIASLGASFSLVAGAALSLLVVSFVFAYDGFSGGVDVPPAASALLVESASAQGTPSRGGQPAAASAVLIRPAPAVSRPATRSGARPARSTTARPARSAPAFNPGVRNLNPVPAAAVVTPAPSQPVVGDGVRDVGDAVSATVQGTGKSAGAATAPLLGPPVSQAVQDVLDLLTSVLQGAASAVGGVIDTAVPK